MAETVKLAIHKGAEAEVEIGGLRFRACRREVGDFDGGITLQVFDANAAAEPELLRFDCFRKSPHYHAPAENPAETKIDPGTHRDGAEWAIDQLSNNTRALLEQGGFGEVADDLDESVLREAVPRLQSLFASLPEPTDTSYFEVDPALIAELQRT
jgi:hypothetical protein